MVEALITEAPTEEQKKFNVMTLNAVKDLRTRVDKQEVSMDTVSRWLADMYIHTTSISHEYKEQESVILDCETADFKDDPIMPYNGGEPLDYLGWQSPLDYTKSVIIPEPDEGIYKYAGDRTFNRKITFNLDSAFMLDNPWRTKVNNLIDVIEAATAYGVPKIPMVCVKFWVGLYKRLKTDGDAVAISTTYSIYPGSGQISGVNVIPDSVSTLSFGVCEMNGSMGNATAEENMYAFGGPDTWSYTLKYDPTYTYGAFITPYFEAKEGGTCGDPTVWLLNTNENKFLWGEMVLTIVLKDSVHFLSPAVTHLDLYGKMKDVTTHPINIVDPTKIADDIPLDTDVFFDVT